MSLTFGTLVGAGAIGVEALRSGNATKRAALKTNVLAEVAKARALWNGKAIPVRSISHISDTTKLAEQVFSGRSVEDINHIINYTHNVAFKTIDRNRGILPESINDVTAFMNLIGSNEAYANVSRNVLELADKGELALGGRSFGLGKTWESFPIERYSRNKDLHKAATEAIHKIFGLEKHPVSAAMDENIALVEQAKRIAMGGNINFIVDPRHPGATHLSFKVRGEEDLMFNIPLLNREGLVVNNGFSYVNPRTLNKNIGIMGVPERIGLSDTRSLSGGFLDIIEDLQARNETSLLKQLHSEADTILYKQSLGIAGLEKIGTHTRLLQNEVIHPYDMLTKNVRRGVLNSVFIGKTDTSMAKFEANRQDIAMAIEKNFPGSIMAQDPSELVEGRYLMLPEEVSSMVPGEFTNRLQAIRPLNESSFTLGGDGKLRLADLIGYSTQEEVNKAFVMEGRPNVSRRVLSVPREILQEAGELMAMRTGDASYRKYAALTGESHVARESELRRVQEVISKSVGVNPEFSTGFQEDFFNQFHAFLQQEGGSGARITKEGLLDYLNTAEGISASSRFAPTMNLSDASMKGLVVGFGEDGKSEVLHGMEGFNPIRLRGAARAGNKLYFDFDIPTRQPRYYSIWGGKGEKLTEASDQVATHMNAATWLMYKEHLRRAQAEGKSFSDYFAEYKKKSLGTRVNETVIPYRLNMEESDFLAGLREIRGAELSVEELFKHPEARGEVGVLSGLLNDISSELYPEAFGKTGVFDIATRESMAKELRDMGVMPAVAPMEKVNNIVDYGWRARIRANQIARRGFGATLGGDGKLTALPQLTAQNVKDPKALIEQLKNFVMHHQHKAPDAFSMRSYGKGYVGLNAMVESGGIVQTGQEAALNSEIWTGLKFGLSDYVGKTDAEKIAWRVFDRSITTQGLEVKEITNLGRMMLGKTPTDYFGLDIGQHTGLIEQALEKSSGRNDYIANILGHKPGQYKGYYFNREDTNILIPEAAEGSRFVGVSEGGHLKQIDKGIYRILQASGKEQTLDAIESMTGPYGTIASILRKSHQNLVPGFPGGSKSLAITSSERLIKDINPIDNPDFGEVLKSMGLKVGSKRDMSEFSKNFVTFVDPETYDQMRSSFLKKLNLPMDTPGYDALFGVINRPPDPSGSGTIPTFIMSTESLGKGKGAFIGSVDKGHIAVPETILSRLRGDLDIDLSTVVPLRGNLKDLSTEEGRMMNKIISNQSQYIKKMKEFNEGSFAAKRLQKMATIPANYYTNWADKSEYLKYYWMRSKQASNRGIAESYFAIQPISHALWSEPEANIQTRDYAQGLLKEMHEGLRISHMKTPSSAGSISEATGLADEMVRTLTGGQTDKAATISSLKKLSYAVTGKEAPEEAINMIASYINPTAGTRQAQAMDEASFILKMKDSIARNRSDALKTILDLTEGTKYKTSSNPFAESLGRLGREDIGRMGKARVVMEEGKKLWDVVRGDPLVRRAGMMGLGIGGAAWLLSRSTPDRLDLKEEELQAAQEEVARQGGEIPADFRASSPARVGRIDGMSIRGRASTSMDNIDQAVSHIGNSFPHSKGRIRIQDSRQGFNRERINDMVKYKRGY